MFKILTLFALTATIVSTPLRAEVAQIHLRHLTCLENRFVLKTFHTIPYIKTNLIHTQIISDQDCNERTLEAVLKLVAENGGYLLGNININATVDPICSSLCTTQAKEKILLSIDLGLENINLPFLTFKSKKSGTAYCRAPGQVCPF